MARKKPISARIEEDTLYYVQQAAGNVNGLINNLLTKWMNDNIQKQMTLWKEETGTDEFSQLAEKHTEHNSQCCNNCTFYKNQFCKKIEIVYTYGKKIDKNKFCCIYWEKKKERH